MPCPSPRRASTTYYLTTHDMPHKKISAPRHTPTTCLCSTTHSLCLHDMPQKRTVAHDIHPRHGCDPRHASTTPPVPTTCIHDILVPTTYYVSPHDMHVKKHVLHDILPRHACVHPRHTSTHDILRQSPRHAREKACAPRHTSTTWL